jgi:hypothetical protein
MGMTTSDVVALAGDQAFLERHGLDRPPTSAPGKQQHVPSNFMISLYIGR